MHLKLWKINIGLEVFMKASFKELELVPIATIIFVYVVNGLTSTQRIEADIHIHASRGSVLTFSVNQYTLARGNGADDTLGCVLFLDHVEV